MKQSGMSANLFPENIQHSCLSLLLGFLPVANMTSESRNELASGFASGLHLQLVIKFKAKVAFLAWGLPAFP